MSKRLTLLFLTFCLSFSAKAQFPATDTLSFSWQELSNPPTCVKDFHRFGNRIFGRNGSQIFYTDDLGENWQFLGDFENIVKFAANDSMVVMITYDTRVNNTGVSGTITTTHTIHVSRDGGQFEAVKSFVGTGSLHETTWYEIQDLKLLNDSVFYLFYSYHSARGTSSDYKLGAFSDYGNDFKEHFRYPDQTQFAFADGYYCRPEKYLLNFTQNANFLGYQVNRIPGAPNETPIQFFSYKNKLHVGYANGQIFRSGDIENWNWEVLDSIDLMGMFVSDGMVFRHGNAGVFKALDDDFSVWRKIYEFQYQIPNLNLRTKIGFFQNGYFINTNSCNTITSFDEGITWNTKSVYISGNSAAWHLQTDSLLITSYLSGQVYYSEEGLQWFFFNNTNLYDIRDKDGNNPGIVSMEQIENRMFALTNERQFARIFASDDGGKNWISVFESLDNKSLNTLKKVGNRLFVYGEGSAKTAIYFSDDKGTSWQSVGLENPFPEERFSSIVIDENYVYAVQYSVIQRENIYRKKITGGAWELINTLPYVNRLFISKGVLIATEGKAQSAIHVSGDKGENWVQMTDSLTNITPGVFDVFNVIEGRLFLQHLPSFNVSPQYFVSDDFGISWKFLDNLPLDEASFFAHRNQLYQSSNHRKFSTNLESFLNQTQINFDTIYQTETYCKNDTLNGLILENDTTILSTTFDSLGVHVLISDIKVLPEEAFMVDIEIIKGDTVFGIPIFSDTVFVENLTNQFGCDSIVTTQIQVKTSNISEPSEKDLSFRIYPNPHSNICYLKFQTKKRIPAKVHLFDALGKPIFADEVVFENEKEYSIFEKNNDYPSGIYVLRIEIEGRFFTKKIIRIE